MLSGTSGSVDETTTGSVDETLTATGRPRRGAARVAQANVTKTLHEKMNSKKRRPTDMSASNSDTSLATSSTGSLTKKMQTVVIHLNDDVLNFNPTFKKIRILGRGLFYYV